MRRVGPHGQLGREPHDFLSDAEGRGGMMRGAGCRVGVLQRATWEWGEAGLEEAEGVEEGPRALLDVVARTVGPNSLNL